MNRGTSNDFESSVKRVAINEMPKKGIEKFKTLIYQPKKSCPFFIMLYTAIAIVFIAATNICFDPIHQGFSAAYIITMLAVIIIYGIFTFFAVDRMKNRKIVTTIFEHPSSKSGLMKVTEDSNTVIFYGKKTNVHSRGDTVWVAYKAIMYADGVTNREYDDAATTSKKIDLYYYRSEDGKTLRLVYICASDSAEETGI